MQNKKLLKKIFKYSLVALPFCFLFGSLAGYIFKSVLEIILYTILFELISIIGIILIVSDISSWIKEEQVKYVEHTIDI